MSREYPELTPHLDLYNFTDSLAIDSRYVLTSPRSLEACARHNIKPLQLLPKTKKEFVQGLASTESYNKDLIEVMYKKSERDRLKLLRMCREERERIIDEQASHKMLQDKLLHGYEESDEESIEDIEASDAWHTLKPAERDERTPRTSTKVKPSILSFLDPESSPRFRPHISPRTYGATSNEMSAKEKTFNVLPGSDSDEDDICSGRYSQRSARIHSWKPTSATRPSSAATKKVKDLNLSDVSANLPVSLQKNLSLMSDKDRRLLEVMMSKGKEEKESRKVSLSGELNYSEEIPQMSLIHQQKLKKKEQKQINKLKEREERMNDVRLRKEAIDREAQLHREAELNVKNSKWQREYNKQMQKKTNQISDGSYYDHAEFERKKRLEHDALLNDMEDKELHAQQSFQNQMKKKRLQRDKKKIKEMERKEQQERNLKAMQKDLELWQRELAEFQNVPLQLLPKTKKEFVQGLASTESYNKDLIEVMYKKSERDRLKLLRMCREERERIIDEQASHKMLQDKLLHGYEESDEESIEDIEASDAWHTLKPAERDERTPRTSTKVKPSILSFLDPESSPRFRPHISPRTYGATSNEMSAKEKTFNVLPGSDSDEDDICSGRYSQRSARIHSWKPTSATRPSSAATKKVKDLNLSDVSANLPVSLQKNLSLMSDKDRRLLEVMMSKGKEEKERRKVSLSGELNYSEEIPQMSLIHQQKLKKKEQKQINKLKEREERMNDVRLRKEAIDREAQLHREAELNVKNSKWQREYNKQMQKKTNQISDGSYYDHAEFERKKRLEHDVLLNDMEDKELHAQQSFQNQMKKKRLQRDKKKIKEMERKEQQERNLKAMQKDLELWQRELAEFQNVSTKRVDNVVDSRNVSKSMKAHNKRLQKELHHLSVKAKVDEEERLRQEELRALINLKDKRSKLIQQEKEEYSNMSRGAARASRAVRDVIKEQTFKSSFAEMAAEAEKVARIEKLGQQHKKPSSLGSVSKNTTTMLLG